MDVLLAAPGPRRALLLMPALRGTRHSPVRATPHLSSSRPLFNPLLQRSSWHANRVPKPNARKLSRGEQCVEFRTPDSELLRRLLRSQQQLVHAIHLISFLRVSIESALER